MEGKGILVWFVDYDNSTKKYEILLEEGISEEKVKVKDEVKEHLRWNPRNLHTKFLLQIGNYSIYKGIMCMMLIVYCIGGKQLKCSLPQPYIVLHLSYWAEAAHRVRK